MAQMYTIEEAAAKLNLSVEEFKRRARTEWTQLRIFRDGSTIRYRSSDIDELARNIGLGSSEELQLADSDELELPGEIGLADEAVKPPQPTQAVSRPQKSTQPAPKPKPADDEPLQLDSDEIFLLDDPALAPAKKTGSDSDVRLEKGGKKIPSKQDDSDEESILTEELDLPTGSSAKLTGKSGKLSSTRLLGSDSGKMKPPAKPEPDSSEFELSLAPDSDEFELSLTDSSEEVSLGEAPPAKGKAGASGINLGRPADSGVSLEKRGKTPPKAPAKQDDSDEEIDFELSLDAPGSGKSATKFGSGKKLQADSDSEFELTLEEPSDLALEGSDAGVEKKDDIFEATDFEIPALDDDSASEAIALDEGDTDLESSDFDLDLDAEAGDDSESQVVALDEDDTPTRPAKLKGKGGKKSRAADDDDDVVDLDDMELETGSSASSALRGVRSDEDDDDLEVTEAAEDDERSVVVAGPAPWGALPAVLLFPTLAVLFLGVILAYELMHSAWGHSQTNKPTTPLTNWVAETAGLKPAQ